MRITPIICPQAQASQCRDTLLWEEREVSTGLHRGSQSQPTLDPGQLPGC